jgi:hypothetical protein
MKPNGLGTCKIFGWICSLRYWKVLVQGGRTFIVEAESFSYVGLNMSNSHVSCPVDKKPAYGFMDDVSTS